MKRSIKYRKIKWLESLLRRDFVRKFIPATKSDSDAESNHLFFTTYIRAAGGCSLLGNRVLSLLPASGFSIPTPELSRRISSLFNSDK
jgi:hypothetical protein